jgi:hypothetical protein
MAEVTATVKETKRSIEAARNKEAELNDPERRGVAYIAGDANLRRPPMGYVYIYNVSPIEHRIERPWVKPQRLGKVIVLPACKPGEKYSSPFIIPDPLQEVTPRIAGSADLVARGVDARFYAQDAICPDQPHSNWRTLQPMNAAAMGGEGTNLYTLGAFWEETNPPSDEAVAKARERLAETFNGLVRQGSALHAANKTHEITFLQHEAAEYLHVNVDWHKKYRPEVECPGCGQFVHAGIARHMDPNCKWVFNWEKALEGGQATMAEAIAAGVMEPPEPATTEKAKK